VSGVHMDISPAVTRKQDISSWKEDDVYRLNSRKRKRYYKRKKAIREYFTSDASLEQIAQRYQIFPVKDLEELAQKCLMRHEDGNVWGYRALVPGVEVADHTPPTQSSIQDTPIPPFMEEQTGDALASEAQLGEEANQINGDASVGTRFIASPTGEQAPQITAVDEQDKVGPLSSDMPQDETALEEEQTVDIPDINLEEAQPDTTEDAGEEQNKTVTLEPPIAGVVAPTVLEPGEQDEAGASAVEDAAGDIAIPDIVEESSTPFEKETETASQNDSLETLPASEDGAEELPAAETLPVEENDEGEQSTPFMEDLVPVEHDDEAVEVMAVSKHGKGDTDKMANPYSFAGKRNTSAHRAIRKRWERDARTNKQKRIRKIVSIIVVLVILLGLSIPLFAGLAAYNAYTSIKGVAMDGVDHLLNVKDLFSSAKSDPTAALDPTKLGTANSDFTQAKSDFEQLLQLVNRPDIQSIVNQFAPQYSDKLDMARRLVQVGIDVSQMGGELIHVAQLGANIVHGSPLASGSSKPLLTPDDITTIEGTLTHALYYIGDVRNQMNGVSVNALPISDSQKKQLVSALALLPKAESYIQQAQGLVGVVSWLLGVGQPRRFLVQTMDRAELRPGGGFTGQYGILTIDGGRVGQFSLRDVTELDYAENGVELGRQAPPQYSMWMKFGNWGLRDANLSGDFPTTARLAMQVFQEEGGGPVDGDIAFTPILIEHVLQVLGPIQVAQYNETITAQNLEDKLHYYQQNQQAIAVQRQKSGTNNAATRKTFTNLLGKLLLERVRHARIKQLIDISKLAIKDIQSRDLEIYFNNPQAEGWLVDHGYSGAMDTFTKTDGFMVVQANISISKASQYVHSTFKDDVVLDAQGGATHNLTITLDYQQKGPVYGQDTYVDYIRVYAPANAQFISGDGFDTGKPLCVPPSTKTTTGTGAGPTPTPPTGCSQYAHYFPSDARYCPDGNYQLTGPNSFVPGKGFVPWPVDKLGAPTAMTSDLPGRAMWGGMTETPKNCISTITLSWYVPHAVKHTAGQSPYSILVQKQGGLIPTVDITIDTSALKGIKPYHFAGDLIADRLFSLAPLPVKKS